MKKLISLGMLLVSAQMLLAVNAGTDAILNQIQQQESGSTTQFKSVIRAAVRYGDAKNFVALAKAAGLQNALDNYGGKKKVKGKKNKKMLKLIPQGQQLTVLAPINSVLTPMLNKIKRAAKGAAKKAARAEAMTLLQAHIIKGALKQADLKGQIVTLGGTKINADKLQFYQADVIAGNGMLHLIKTLAVAASVPAAPAAAAVKPSAKNAVALADDSDDSDDDDIAE